MVTCDTFYTIQHFIATSADEWPSGVPNGSRMLEVDTGDRYIYNAEADRWEGPYAGLVGEW